MLASVTQVPLGLFACIFVTAAVPALLTVGLTSGMSAWSHQFYFFLGAAGHADQTKLFLRSIVVGVVMFIMGYVLDVAFLQSFVGKLVGRLYNLAAVVFLLGGLLGLTPTAPSIPIMVGIACTALAVAALRRLTCAETPVDEFSIAASLAFFALHALLVAIWAIWAFSPLFGGYASWSSQEAISLEHGFLPLTSFIMWSSPVIVSVGCFIMGIFTAVRSQFHVPDDLDEPLDAQSVTYIQGELKTVMLCLGFAVISVWVAASLAVQDFKLAESVLRLSVATVIGAVTYVLSAIGLERIRIEAEKNAGLRESQEILTNDWCKAFFVLIFWPLLPAYFALEALHQVFRVSCWWVSGADTRTRTRSSVILGYASEPEWLAREARGFWLNIAGWDKAAVLTKTMYVGLLLFALQVIPSQALPLVLSWLNEQIASWPLVAILSVLFGVGLILFMLPPIPGLPIYLLTGVIVTERCRQNGMGFQVGCIISILFSYCLKMTACAVQMRGIGGPLSESIAVKKAIGVHTPTLKSIKYILSQEGFHADKIAVLCGGPDWPTYVTAGILNLRVSEMLLGGSPVVLMIIPFCLTSAFTTRAGHETEAEMTQYYHYLSSVMAIASSLCMLCYMSVAGYCVHRTSEAHREEFEHGDLSRDPQEQAVLASIEADEREARALGRRTGWASMPAWLKVLLLLGAGLCSLMTHVLLEPVPALNAFEDFQLTDSISSLPRGSALAIIRGPGWFCLGCFVISSGILFSRGAWAAAQVASEEDDPLLLGNYGNEKPGYESAH